MSPKESVKNERVIELIKGGVEDLGVRGLARALGISPAIVTRYTQGKVGEPSQSTLEKLADYFEVHVAWLRGEWGNMSYEKAKEYKKIKGSGQETGWVKDVVFEDDFEKIFKEVAEKMVMILMEKYPDKTRQELFEDVENTKKEILDSVVRKLKDDETP